MSTVQHIVFIGIGSNIGARAGHLKWAVAQLLQHDQVYHVTPSPVYESEAHVLDESNAQPPYLNAVLKLDTDLAPEPLLSLLNQLEKKRGRNRHAEKRWSSRTLDLDILAYADFQVRTSNLQIPHRRLDQRKFVLVPWADIAKDYYVPAPFELTVAQLLHNCKDNSSIKQTSISLSTNTH